MNSYTFTITPVLTSAYRSTMVGDYHSRKLDPKLDALVRSGDYFITVATRLEVIAANLADAPIAVSSLELAKLADDLEYVQQHYHITPKRHPDPLTELG